MPHGHVGRIVKALVANARATGWQGWVRDSIVIASRETLPIEDLLSEATGERELLFSLSPGTPGTFQKLTVQVMRSDGSILGYMKMPMTASADERLRHEAAVVRDLDSYEELRPHIPRLIFAGSLQGRYVIFQSALQGSRGPLCYDSLHENFLKRLHSGQYEAGLGNALLKKQPSNGTGWCVEWEQSGNSSDERPSELRRVNSTAGKSLAGLRMAISRLGICASIMRPSTIRLGISFLSHALVVGPVSFYDPDGMPSQNPARSRIGSGRTQGKPELIFAIPPEHSAAVLGGSGEGPVIRYREEQLLRFMSTNDHAS